jgi:hypothetical protein
VQRLGAEDAGGFECGFGESGLARYGFSYRSGFISNLHIQIDSDIENSNPSTHKGWELGSGLGIGVGFRARGKEWV